MNARRKRNYRRWNPRIKILEQAPFEDKETGFVGTRTEIIDSRWRRYRVLFDVSYGYCYCKSDALGRIVE